MPTETMKVKKEGWILGPQADRYLFIGPILFALVASNTLAYNSFYFTAVWIFIGTFDAAHVMATTPALLNRMYGRRLSKFIFWAILILIPPFIFALYSYSTALFISLLAYLALFHICRQQHGWVMVSRARFGEKQGRIFDSLELLNIVIAPIIWWHSPYSNIAHTYFFKGDLVLELPAQLAQAALIIHFAYHAFYIWHFFARTERNYGKAFLFLTTWIWFFGGLVIDNEGTFFWITLILSHGLPYIYLSSKTLKTQVKGFESIKMQYRWVAFGIFLLATAAAWALTLPPGKGAHVLHNPLVWSPLILHYVYDGFIWRKSAFDPLIGV